MDKRAKSFDRAVLERAHCGVAAAHGLGNFDTGQRGEAQLDHLLLIDRQLGDGPVYLSPHVESQHMVVERIGAVLDVQDINLFVATNPKLIHHRVVRDREKPGCGIRSDGCRIG